MTCDKGLIPDLVDVQNDVNGLIFSVTCNEGFNPRLYHVASFPLLQSEVKCKTLI